MFKDAVGQNILFFINKKFCYFIGKGIIIGKDYDNTSDLFRSSHVQIGSVFKQVV